MIDALYNAVPPGTGSAGRISLTDHELDQVLLQGSQWAAANGYALAQDLEHTEDFGQLSGADQLTVSSRDKRRGQTQLGTLGSGNHFLEVQYDVIQNLLKLGIVAKATSREGLTEEVPEAYKSVDQVVSAVEGAGIARPVARLKPMGVIKG